jgi:hypothetical protein
VEIQEILPLFDREQRQEITYPDLRKESLPEVVRFMRPAPGMSFILYSRLNEGNADAVIEAQIAYFSAKRLSFEWKVYEHDRPADLRDRLVAHGFEVEDSDAVMVLDLADASPALVASPAADVRAITERTHLEDVRRVEQQVWGRSFEWLKQRLGAHLNIPGYLNVYVSYTEGQPACTGWIYFPENSQFASLWGGSTVPEYRGRGLYTAILAARVQEAIRRGRRFLVIDTSPMSQPIVARHGFRLLTVAHACEWHTGNRE